VAIVDPSAVWTTVSNVTTNPYRLTGLTAETSYEVQAQAVVNDGGKWSGYSIFTTTNNTLELADDDSSLSTKNTSLIEVWNGITADVTFSGRTLYKDGNWNTLCLPFAVSNFTGTPLEGATVKELDVTNTDLDTNGQLTLKFTEVTSIEAGKPYIVMWAKAANYEENENLYDITDPKFTNVTISSTAPTAVTKNPTTGGKLVSFVGQYSSFSIGDNSNTPTFDGDLNEIILLSSNNQLGYSKNPRPLRAFRAHFYVPYNDAGGGGAKVRSFNVDFGDGEVNSIIAVSADSVGPKDSAWYTISGVRLNGKPTQKGLYIHQGKKIMVR
jgi:hypothetical protein